MTVFSTGLNIPFRNFGLEKRIPATENKLEHNPQPACLRRFVRWCSACQAHGRIHTSAAEKYLSLNNPQGAYPSKAGKNLQLQEIRLLLTESPVGWSFLKEMTFRFSSQITCVCNFENSSSI